MSELRFQHFCGSCYAPLSLNTGLVLSCGDFLCDKCKILPSDECPSCGAKNIRSASLVDPPDEVYELMHDTTESLEKLYSVMKFQSMHYRDMLSRVHGRMKKITQQLQESQRRSERLERELLQLQQQIEQRRDEHFDQAPSRQPSFVTEQSQAARPVFFWKTGNRSTQPKDLFASSDNTSASITPGRSSFKATPQTDTAANNGNASHKNSSANRSIGRDSNNSNQGETKRQRPNSTPSRIRSPYLPYVMSPTKSVKMSQLEARSNVTRR